MEKQQVYDILSEAYFSEDRHERVVTDNLPSILKGVTTFVDAGASLGQYTYLYAACVLLLLFIFWILYLHIVCVV